jgi:hypothetical protein
LASSIVNEYYKILRSRARWALTGFTKRGEEKKTHLQARIFGSLTYFFRSYKSYEFSDSPCCLLTGRWSNGFASIILDDIVLVIVGLLLDPERILAKF